VCHKDVAISDRFCNNCGSAILGRKIFQNTSLAEEPSTGGQLASVRLRIFSYAKKDGELVPDKIVAKVYLQPAKQKLDLEVLEQKYESMLQRFFLNPHSTWAADARAVTLHGGAILEGPRVTLQPWDPKILSILSFDLASMGLGWKVDERRY
jgi:hypothetical protein